MLALFDNEPESILSSTELWYVTVWEFGLYISNTVVWYEFNVLHVYIAIDMCVSLSLSLSRSIPRVVVHLKSKMQSPPIFIYIRLFRSIATTDLSPVTEKHTPPDSKHF